MKKKVNHATLNEKKKKIYQRETSNISLSYLFVACERVYLVTIMHIELSP